MAYTSFILEQFTGSPIKVNFKLTEVNETIKVEASVANSYVGDLRGVFFHIGDESLINTLDVTGADVTTEKYGPANTVKEVGGANIQSTAGFDFAFEIGTSGIGGNPPDDFGSTTFIISSSLRDLTLADF